MVNRFKYLFLLLLGLLLIGKSIEAGFAKSFSFNKAFLWQQGAGKLKINGIVKDENNEPLPYVSLGIVNEESGTVTDENGAFTILIPSGKEAGTLRFSYIGYQPVELTVKDAIAQFSKQRNLVIKLKPAGKDLTEVKVDAKRWVTSVKGGKVGPGATFHQAFMRTPGTTEEHLGREVAIQINNKKQAFLKKLSFCINANKYKDVKFRLNIYSLAGGRPHENILKENIYIEIEDGASGWQDLDLEPYNIYLKDDFVLSLEWIDSFPKPKNVMFLTLSGGFGTHTVFQKKASQASWLKIPGAGIGLNVTMQHEK